MMIRPFLLTALLLLSACGFHPLYGQSRAAENLAAVSIDNIEGKNGQKLRLQLSDQFYGAQAPTSPQWQVSVKFTTTKQELGIRQDATATRARLILVADFELRRVGEEKPMFKGSERSFVSYNILTDPYATLAAEDNAMDRGLTQVADGITNRIALYLAGQTQ